MKIRTTPVLTSDGIDYVPSFYDSVDHRGEEDGDRWELLADWEEVYLRDADTDEDEGVDDWDTPPARIKDTA